MSSSSDYLLDSVISEALELPSSLRQEYVRKTLHADPALLAKAMDLLKGLENEAPTSFLDQPPIIEDAGSLIHGLLDDPGAPALKPGDYIKTFQIVELLDEGGMGEVYLAEQQIGKIKRKAAIKVVHDHLATDEVLQRFKHEQQILAGLQHPNIATLFDADVTEDGLPFLAMEYIEGKHIDAHCDSKSLSIEERLKLFKTVCEAVQYAQDNLVVHRDLKPSNILVTKRGKDVKLLDFGIAKLRDSAQDKPRTEPNGQSKNGQLKNGLPLNGAFKNGQLNGVSKHTQITQLHAPFTPAYAAPEQVLGEPVNAATDVYSLGVILFKLLTGLLPLKDEKQTTEENQDTTGIQTSDLLKPSRQLTRYKTETDKNRSQEISRERGYKRLTHLRRELSGDLDAIVIKALEQEGKNRYASAGELGRDIQRYLDRRPIQARPQTFGYRCAKFVRRYHRTAIATLIGFLVLIGGIITTAREANKKEQARQTQTATVGFIENILEKVDPDKKEGYSFTTKELIVAGLSELQHLETQPQVHADIMNDFGKIALNARLFDLADSLHHQALLIQQNIPGNNNSDLSITYTRIATVLADKKDYQNATLQFLEALTLDPQNHIARNNLGELLYNQGKFKEAVEQYSLAYQIAPNEVRYLRNIGASFFNLSDWKKSKQAYLQSIEIEPHYNAFASLATIFYTIDKDYLSAANYYERALELNDQDYDMWGYLASALFAANPESPKARESNQKAIMLAEEHLEKLDPNDPYVHVVLAGYYGRAGNFAKAQYHLDKTFESTNIDDLAFDIGYAYEVMGERSMALEYIEQAVDEGSLDIYILNEPAFEPLRQSSYFKENLASKLSTN